MVKLVGTDSKIPFLGLIGRDRCAAIVVIVVNGRNLHLGIVVAQQLNFIGIAAEGIGEITDAQETLGGLSTLDRVVETRLNVVVESNDLDIVHATGVCFIHHLLE